MSLLTIVQNVCGRLALPQPTAVVGSTDRQVLQFLALVNEAGIDLMRDYDWQAIRIELDFMSLAQQAQTGFMPADFDRFVPNSFFNRSTRRPMTGPITPRQHQWIQAQPVYSTVYLAFIMRQNQFLIDPNPAAGNLLACEYVSRNWCQSNGDVAQPMFEADTDTALLDEELLKLSLRWRFLQAKGLDYAEAMTSFERQKERLMARDGGSTMLTLSPQPIDPNRVNIPDGNFAQ